MLLHIIEIYLCLYFVTLLFVTFLFIVTNSQQKKVFTISNYVMGLSEKLILQKYLIKL